MSGRRKLLQLAGIVLGVVLVALYPSLASTAESILEHYSLKPGSDDVAGVRVVLFDPYFGHGSAQSRVMFRGPDVDAAPELSLRVWRSVAPEEITFALLVFRVEVRGYDADGTLVYSRRLRGFTFGDSASGDWRRTLSDLPSETQRVSVIFFGNYE